MIAFAAFMTSFPSPNCRDSAFRFFKVQADLDMGFVLHPADVATNKVPALAGRFEVRDFVDMNFAGF
jgi:hypothetical protein